MKIIIASRNVHKIREFRSMMRKLLPNWDIFSLIDFPDYQPPKETANTFEENAIIKAKHAAKALQSWVIADDSGLVVPTLRGLPGVRSARFAGEKATDKDNRNKLLEEMKGFKDDDRNAYYECCIALASQDELRKTACGRCEGIITEKQRGGQGFGYDCIFKKHEYNKTFAELEEEIKNNISHRRKALNKILMSLETIERNALHH